MRTLLNYFRSPYRCGTGEVDWKRIGIWAYALMALVAFGHNYNHYPIPAMHYVYCDPPNEKAKCTETLDRVDGFETSFKALLTGALWPLYFSIEAQQVKK